jgi:DNA-binding MarR family transcriptional regulator
LSTAEEQSPEHPTDLNELGRELRLMSSFDALFSQAVAERVGIHSTDMETMDLLLNLGPMTAGELAQRTGLSSGATTRLIDRLERAGYVRRSVDEADRRRVIVLPDPANLGKVMALFEPLISAINAHWANFRPDQRKAILAFLRGVNKIVAEQNARVRASLD